MKKSLLMKTLLLLCALIVGSTSSWAVEQVYYTLDPITGTNNSYAGNCDVTIDEITWNVTGNATFTPWRIGGKSLSGVDRAVYSKTAMGEAITKVNLAIGDASSITINSVKLIVSTEANGLGTKIDEVTKTSVSANSTLTFTPTTPLTEWAKNAYYKFVFNVTVTGSSNKFVQFSSADFYYNMATSATLDHITLGGTYQTEFEQGSDFNHDGLTVTAHYSDASTLDVTSSATFTGYNMNTLGAQTVTVSYTEGGTTKTANYGINVVPVPTAVVTLDFTSNDDWGISVSPTKTVDATEFTSGGYTITLEGSAGNGYYFDGDNIMLGKQGATLTLPAFGFNVSKIKVHGTSGGSGSVKFNIYVGEDAVSTEATSSKVDHEFAIAAEKQDVGTIYVIKVTNGNNMRISKIEVYGNGCEAGVVTDAAWATYVTTCDMEFAEGDAFVVSTANATTATLTGVTKIRANQPVLLKGEGAKTAKVLEEAPAAVSNELAISTGGEINGYVLAKKSGVVGFYKWAGGSLTSGKVYLPIPAGAREYLEFSFDNETTGLSEELRMKNEESAAAWYDLQGRKVAQPTKGLYIVNGKKVVIK